MDLTSRAQIYTFSESELQTLFPEIDYPTEAFEEVNNLEARLLEDLDRRGIHLHKGDLVHLTIYEEDGIVENPGKYIFDGNQLHDLTGADFNEALEDFEVLTQFPPRYWQGQLEGNVVYYNFQRNQPQFDLSQVEQLGAFFYYPVSHQGITYQIISDTNPNGDEELTAAGFLRELLQNTIFGIEPQNPELSQFFPTANNRIYLLIEDLKHIDNSPDWTEQDQETFANNQE